MEPSAPKPAAKELAMADDRHGAGASTCGNPFASSGASSSEFGAPDGQLADASGISDDDSETGSETFSGEEGEGEETQSDEERDCIEKMAPDGAAAKDTQPAAALEQEAPAQPMAPAGPAEPLTSISVAARASAMFVVGSAEARASGLPINGKEPTKELVQLALVAANELCDTHGKTGIIAEQPYLGGDNRVRPVGWAPLAAHHVPPEVGVQFPVAGGGGSSSSRSAVAVKQFILAPRPTGRCAPPAPPAAQE